MKKLFSLVLVVSAMLFATEAGAQIKFGVKGGLNVTDMSFNSKVLSASNRTGFYIGPTMKFTLPVIGLGVDASALYDYRSAKVSAFADDKTVVSDETVKQEQIAVPVNLRYGFGLGQTAELYFFAGPQFGFNVGNDAEKPINWKWKESNFSVNLGAGLMLLNHLQLNANYNIACGKTAEATFDKVKTGIKGKSNSWQIGLAYYF